MTDELHPRRRGKRDKDSRSAPLHPTGGGGGGISFRDTSTECAICLGPLYNDSQTWNNEGCGAGVSTMTTIELGCGHVWHLECIRQQLQHAQPTPAQRLLFSGCRCAKCGVFCDHEALHDLTRTTDVFRSQVDDLIAEQLQIDFPDVWRHASAASCTNRHENIDDDNNSKNNRSSALEALMEEGRRKYAFYLCGHCHQPYFGGTVECAEQDHREQTSSEDRLCPGCSTASHRQCRDPTDHRSSLVWKCRYCCSIATFVCYGTVHFCSACHSRSTKRTREQPRNHNAGGPPKLEAIPCPGGEACTHPKLRGQTHHQNGDDVSCEQVYHCAVCQEMALTSGRPRGFQSFDFLEESGSRNWVVNPHGADGVRGWFTHSSRRFHSVSWSVEQSELPLRDDIPTNFVSSFNWAVMSQRIPVYQYLREPCRIEVSAYFLARTDCPSEFRLVATALSDGGLVLQTLDSGILSAPADAWERTSLILDARPLHEVMVTIMGRDCRFWQGNFGSKVTNCSVRALCSPEDRDRILTREGL